jgi:hypothetical protein
LKEFDEMLLVKMPRRRRKASTGKKDFSKLQKNVFFSTEDAVFKWKMTSDSQNGLEGDKL